MRPNIVYIDCHDLGDWLGCYGRPWLDTPHLDALAAQGARFGEHIAAAPICMPSRAAIYTGVMPHELGVTGQEALLLRADTPPLAARFHDVGYRTVLCGRLMVLNDPQEMGFTEQLEATREEQSATAAAFIEAQGRARRAETSSDAERTGAPKIHAPHAGTATSDRRADCPFFLSVSFTQCHRPFGDRYDPEVAGRIGVPPYLPDTEATRRDLATLAWQIQDLDRRVGLILAALDRAGLANDTLVVFTTEHGPAIARAKHTTYDSGLRTALLLRLPGVIPAGTVVDTMTSNVDLLPTLAGLCGLPAPATGGMSWASRPHRRRHRRRTPVRIQRVQLGAAQRRLVLHPEPGDPRPALQADPRLPAHPDLRGLRLAGALRGRLRDGGALVRRAAARDPVVRPAGGSVRAAQPRRRTCHGRHPGRPRTPPRPNTCGPPATRY